MDCTIYFSEISHTSESHRLLERAFSDYLSGLQAVRGDYADLSDRQPDHTALQSSSASGQGLRIETTDSGKPFFPDYPDICFSISHSGKYWACAFSSAEIGLDLQEITDVDGERIAKRFLHPDEWKWLAEAGFDRFCLMWTYKESYLKYTGEGLVGGLNSFSLAEIVRHSQNCETREASGIIKEKPVWQKEISVRPDYHMVCTSAAPLITEVRMQW